MLGPPPELELLVAALLLPLVPATTDPPILGMKLLRALMELTVRRAGSDELLASIAPAAVPPQLESDRNVLLSGFLLRVDSAKILRRPPDWGRELPNAETPGTIFYAENVSPVDRKRISTTPRVCPCSITTRIVFYG